MFEGLDPPCDGKGVGARECVESTERDDGLKEEAVKDEEWEG